MASKKTTRRSILYFPWEKQNVTGLSVNLARRVIIIKNTITSATSLFFLSCLQQLEIEFPAEPIYLIFDSCRGGDCIAAKYMYAIIRAVKPPVIGIAKKFVNSAALIPFAACRERIAYYGTTFQFHTSEIIPNKFSRLTASVHAVLSQNGKITDDEVYAMLTEGFGFSQTYLARMLCEEECNIFLKGRQAKEAKEIGIVHIVLSPRTKKKRR